MGTFSFLYISYHPPGGGGGGGVAGAGPSGIKPAPVVPPMTNPLSSSSSPPTGALPIWLTRMAEVFTAGTDAGADEIDKTERSVSLFTSGVGAPTLYPPSDGCD
mmetsp:Transcript_6473/g.12958  ORF Transcript_6473/g.12958 Transcript_6473/m.12958 type:complete len:104 (-) Transcript_6473:1149-1460(-)